MAATLQIIKKNFPELLLLNLYKNKPCQLNGLSDIIQIGSHSQDAEPLQKPAEVGMRVGQG